uniref:HAD family hydrolase n=1 Tax=uncultured Thiotrichaceae bacterium TaxID=298394 RepID=A0A6S6S7U3_9GAMM|nr:MAG: Unknown protein [uncultured Thiotrichaceae bacterium]
MPNILYALDFDGVICDSALETGLTAWNAAQVIWPDIPKGTAPDGIIEQFRAVRPQLETGYEAPLIIRLLYTGVSVETLVSDYMPLLDALIRSDHLDKAELKQVFGAVRDQWIQSDEKEWLQMNPLFEGVRDKLQGLGNSTWYLITTKQERFAKRILENNQVDIPAQRIYGLDRQLNKQQVLERLIEVHPDDEIIFVEDRLPTLTAMEANPALHKVRRQLVDWGYNTAESRASVNGSGIELISPEQFLQGAACNTLP